MAIYNAAIITPKVRLNLNKGFAQSRYDLTTQKAFDDTITILSDWLSVGRETVMRWYGFQRNAHNRIVPKLAEGFTMANLKLDDTEIIDPFTGFEIDDERKEQLRYRCLIAAVVGHNEGPGNEPYEINWGLWREPIWTGKKRIITKNFDDIREMIEYAYAVWVGEDSEGAGAEGAYLYRAWYHIQGGYIPAEGYWSLDIYCKDRGKSGPVDPNTGLPSLDESDAEEKTTDDEGAVIE